MKFSVIHNDKDTDARTCRLTTSRGTIETPVFMPVATRGTIRALTMRDLEEIGFEIILANTYHLYIRPGLKVLESAGGLHKFMNYSGPILTDSGGFQVFSMSDLCTVQDDGIEFRSHLDGSKHLFTPSRVLDIQKTIGSDIMMVLDQCINYPVSNENARLAMERTIDWAQISLDYWNNTFNPEIQTLFAIVQGSTFPDLRKECTLRLTEMDFPGYAIGGLSVGEPKALYREMTDTVCALLPSKKPRYMMGVGSPMEMLHAIGRGVDMFDCVMPTRIARNGTLYTSTGRINIKALEYEHDYSPLDEACSCYVCKNFSRSYLRHLFRVGEISSLIYNTIHNLSFMKSFINEIQESIKNDQFALIFKKWDAIYGENQ